MQWRIENQLIEYKYALEFMEQRVRGIIDNSAEELVWLLEHPELYTAGISASNQELKEIYNIPVFHVSRGGKFTYHGPGQRIIYLMLDLNKRGKDVKKFVYQMEQWIITSLAAFELNCFRKKDYIGIWCKDDQGKDVKIAAIGVKLKKWVSYHGIAINVNPNLEYFNGIIPCGIENYEITSLKKLAINIELKELDEQLLQSFSNFF